MYRWLLASERDRLSQRDGGGHREIVSPLVVDDGHQGQQTFFSLIRWDLVFLLSKVLTTLQCTTTSKQVGSCLANANSKIFFACGANKKAFGQIDQPKGTRPRETTTLGDHGSCAFSRADTDSRPRRPRTSQRRPRTRRRKGVLYII